MQDHDHFLGVARRDGRPLWLDQQARYQHAYVLGQTGTGKSSWARQSFMQDVIAGRGGCYFDFHGEDARWLLDHIPPERASDVMYINPLKPSRSPSRASLPTRPTTRSSLSTNPATPSRHNAARAC